MFRHPFMCSEDGQDLVRRALDAGDVDRVVVAACSPRHHGDVFHQAVEGHGHGREPVMANIREHCAWVTPDMDAATDKAVALVRAATAVVEQELADSGAFQYLAVLLNDRATGIRDNKREFGQIIVLRCIESTDARTATATPLPWDKLNRICERITQMKDVNRCLYDMTPKPPATIEYI